MVVLQLVLKGGPDFAKKASNLVLSKIFTLHNSQPK